MMEDAPVINTSSTVEPETAPASLGRLLREAREAQGFSVSDVAARIKLAERQIEALEADDYTRLPELAFVRGFVRSYAKALGLDSESLLKTIPGDKQLAPHVIPASVEVPFPTAASIHQKNLMLLAASLFLAVAVVAFAVWHFTHPATTSEPDEIVSAQSTEAIATPIALPADMQIIEASSVAAVSAASAVVTPISAAIPAPILAASAVASVKPVAASVSGNAPLRFVFGSEESWVEVKDRDGKIISSQVNPPGSELALSGKAPFSFVIAHAASVKLYYKGKQVDLQAHTTTLGHVARLTLE